MENSIKGFKIIGLALAIPFTSISSAYAQPLMKYHEKRERSIKSFGMVYHTGGSVIMILFLAGSLFLKWGRNPIVTGG